MTDQLRHFAYHESSHGVVGLALGATIDLLSIRPGKSHAGITFPDSLPTWTGNPAELVMYPLPLAPADFRRAFEVRICLSLAGEIGEYLAFEGTGFVPTIPCPSQPERLARQLTDLSPRHGELLKAAEAVESWPGDGADAHQAALALGTDEEASALVQLCRIVTRQLVALYAREIHSVAAELERLQVLTGDEVQAAMEAAYPPIKGAKTA